MSQISIDGQYANIGMPDFQGVAFKTCGVAKNADWTLPVVDESFVVGSRFGADLFSIRSA
ncbi:hypothetical protein [Jeongeupia naejangsanensis]|uniref:Uncharacterized protein n=1 Tax=Jeongeupia naejangsanensis TaxID=613195 RepID=A0ABS2BL32_9NEIS|nr:hypothetical protein [Jeongeupia naejangsanensis]MBM3116325.1 hypothetical protein [Jeongeupia naejangsanensis]